MQPPDVPMPSPSHLRSPSLYHGGRHSGPHTREGVHRLAKPVGGGGGGALELRQSCLPEQRRRQGAEVGADSGQTQTKVHGLGEERVETAADAARQVLTQGGQELAHLGRGSGQVRSHHGSRGTRPNGA